MANSSVSILFPLEFVKYGYSVTLMGVVVGLPSVSMAFSSAFLYSFLLRHAGTKVLTFAMLLLLTLSYLLLAFSLDLTSNED